ncbi:ferroxidase [Ranunculus cassubicifolius]
MATSSRLLVRKLSLLKSSHVRPLSLLPSPSTFSEFYVEPLQTSRPSVFSPSSSSRYFSSHPLNVDEAQVPASIDYLSLIDEDEYHKLADATIEDLQERFEEYGDSIDVDGFDIDYGNQVLTLKLGSLGTYVLNKQTPNRQLWLSSPVSGPSRFDWDKSTQAWVYRRTRVNLLELLESEVKQLCGEPITLS